MERTGFSPAYSVQSSDAIPSSSSSSANPRAPEAKRTRLGGPAVRAMVTRLEANSPSADGSNHHVGGTIVVGDGDDDVTVDSSSSSDDDDDAVDSEDEALARRAQAI